jgi:Cu(I)/Ag(I) efflux system membrane protein CusA/SilA
MIERIITFSIRRRTLIIAAALVVTLAGIYAVYQTPVDAIPDLSENQVIVFTEWPGHSPREIEDQVTYPLSLNLQGLTGVRTVRSSSDFNFSMISIIFEDGAELQSARRQIAERLVPAEGQLPAGVVPRLAPDAAATGQIFWYTVEGGGLDLGRLRALQDWYVRPQLGAVPGVAEVASVGGYATEFQIEVDPGRLQARGLTIDQVARAVERSNSAVGGHVLQKGTAEYIVRGAGWLGIPPGQPTSAFDPQRAVRDLEKVVLPLPGNRVVQLGDVAHVGLGPQFRRGVLEKDGNEVTGGVVLLRTGENPLEVTRRIKAKIQELQAGLPSGVRIVPFYDRTPLIEGAVHTVTATVVEAILTAAVCVLLVLLHLRTSFIIALTLPLAALTSFLLLWTLRPLGLADVQTNIMSLAGIAISIGVLVDAAIVMAENVMHRLQEQFGDLPVRGDTRHLVLPACLTVGRPIFFSVVIMLLSFLPVFALGGMEGKMFRPLAFTKSFALLAVAVLAITLVPALCTLFIKGRLRRDSASWLVRGVMDVYQPVLGYLLRRPAALFWLVSATLVVGLTPLGQRWLVLLCLFVGLLATGLTARHWFVRFAGVASLILIALVAEQRIQPLGWERTVAVDEGMIMDMPISAPRASVTEAADDLKVRDMHFCSFPEVDMVVGKAGRAETPTDPAPLNMIETMINFRPPEFWPRRKLKPPDAERQARAVLDALEQRGMIEPLADSTTRIPLIQGTVKAVLPDFDAQMREYAYQRNQEFLPELGRQLVQTAVATLAGMLQSNHALVRPLGPSDLSLLAEGIPPALALRLAQSVDVEDVTVLAQTAAQKLVATHLAEPGVDLLRYQPNLLVRAVIQVHTGLGGQAPTFFTRLRDVVAARSVVLWHGHVDRLNRELIERAAETYTRLVLLELLDRRQPIDAQLAASVRQLKALRSGAQPSGSPPAGHHHGGSMGPTAPDIEPQPALLALQTDLAQQFSGWLMLWRKDRADLTDFGGELDKVMQMPGWGNVWTMPIQNRVNMLYTGVSTAIGVRVLGRQFDQVVETSERIAAVLRGLRGAVSVGADPIRNRGYLDVQIDRDRAARYGVSVGDINDLVETAVAGKQVTTAIAGRERYPVRLRYARSWRDSPEAIEQLLVPAHGPAPYVRLSQVADVRTVEGPAVIYSENGLLRNYVKLNVIDRDISDFVAEAKSAVARQVRLPPGVYLEWTGQYEHDIQARNTLLVVVPIVVVLIFLILWWTYHDVVDALLMLLAVPGAAAGGVLFQWWFEYKFSVTVSIGYIACFGMATATGIIMLVYLREAVERAGGLAKMSLEDLHEAVMKGAVHRLRPKLLTEATVVVGLAPLLWATGTGAEVIRPMAAPVLGGILIADEVIDLLLPVLFYHVRRWRWRRLHGAEASS